MYVQRESSYPAPGKGAELRACLEERVKAAHAKGRAASLAVQLFAGAAGAGYVRNIRFQDLAAYDATRRQNQADPAFQALTQKITPLLSRPNAIELFEVLIPFPATPVMRAPFFSQRALNYPAVGAGPDLRPLLEARVKAYQASGRRASLSTSVYADDAPVFALTVSFQDLAALDSFRSYIQSDPALQALTARAARLIRQPNKLGLAEVLIPMPM